MAGSGKVPKSVIDEIRERIDIVGVVGEHVQLRKAGASYKGLCPFHDEKSPSFNVSPAKRIYHCFGCGEGGDVFGFMMKKSGMGFRDVLEECASRAGVDISGYRGNYEGPEVDRGDFFTANREATDFFRKALARNDKARGYLAARGLDPVTQEAFSIGYAPDGWSHLLDGMTRAGFDAELLANIGLVKRRREGSGFYDAFRDRIVFPIRDEHSRIVAFGARRIGDGEGPKYINSPESAYYTKGRHLYNLDRALRVLQAGEASHAILCEGYMDVLAFFRAGLPAAVANLGTALTASQAGRMSRAHKRWVLAFDADDAGMKAAVRAVQLLDPLGVELRVLDLAGKDPDEVLQNQGEGALRRAVERARPVDEFLFEATARTHDLGSAPGRSAAFRSLREIYTGLENPVLKQALVRQISDGLSLSEDLVMQALRPSRSGSVAVEEAVRRRPDGRLPRSHQAERTILREVVQDVSLYVSGPAGVLSAGLASDPYVKRALLLLDQVEAEEGPVLQELLELNDEEALARFLRGLEFDEVPAGDDDSVRRVEECLETLQEELARDRLGTLRSEIKDCRDREQRRSLLAEQMELQKQLDELRSRRSRAASAGA